MLNLERFGLVSLITVSSTLCFIVQPFLTLCAIILLAWFYKPIQTRMLPMVALFGAAFIALINTTKVPASDLEKYLSWYDSANGVGLIEFLNLFSREYVYYIWMYSVSFVSAGDEYVFIFLSSWIPYLILMLSILLVCRNFNIRPRITLLIMLIFLFFTPLFSISAHLMRQFFAAALVTTFFAKRIVDRKSSWWVLIAAVFIHYSAFLFVPLALIQSSRKFSLALNVFLSFSALLFVYLLAKAASGYLTDIPVFGLVFHRLAAVEIPVAIGLSFNAKIFVIFILALTLMVMWSRLGRSRRYLVSPYEENLYIVILFVSIIVVASNLSIYTAEIAMRIYFYLYFLAALVVPMFFINNRIPMSMLVAPVMLVTISFFWVLDVGVWHYAAIDAILFLPSWQLWGAS